MEISVKSACLECIDEINASPLGPYVIEKIEQYTKINSHVLTLDQIKENILSNIYHNFLEFIHDMNRSFTESSRFYGKSTKIGLMISTLGQIFEEAIEKKQLAYIKKNTKPTFDFQTLLTHLHESIVNAPISKIQFIVKDSQDLICARPRPVEQEEEPYFDDTILSNFCQYLYRCRSDETVQKYISIFQDLDPDIERTESTITIDLGFMTSYALNILRHEIENENKNKKTVDIPNPQITPE